MRDEGRGKSEGTGAYAWQRTTRVGFTDLIAWQRAYELSLRTYDLTRVFPADERFGLTSQMRRASVSIPSNIAEGWGRGSRADYVRFLHHARGSAFELRTQLWLACDLGYCNIDNCAMNLIDEVERLMIGLIRSLDGGSMSESARPSSLPPRPSGPTP